ncbi:MAG TPA: carboxypeptidase-like regulatory domain-containing protein [Vicinamibacterales bacterium]|nr:carboxypeptidase-like regulatory domain-containing protein [Vicinamibacterales bacterium]
MASPLAPQQKPEPPSGVISGVVVDGTTGEAIPEAVVFLAASPAGPVGGQTRQLTDERGRFAFVQLAGDANYTLSATRFGYLEGGYGRDAMPTDPLRSIPLKASEWIPNIKVAIWKPGAISGAVRDESGEPAVGVVVRALKRVRIQGRDEFVAGPATRTDDRGRYRIHTLPPGRYLVQIPSVQASVPASAKVGEADERLALRPRPAIATEVLDLLDVDQANRLAIGRYAVPPPPANGKHFSYPVIFHPAATSVAEATTIELKFGDDRQNVDLTLTPVQSVRVSGVVEGPPESLRSLTLRLLPAGLENLGFGSEAATALVTADGRFTFLNVPAGLYTVDAPAQISELSITPPQIGPRKILPGPPTAPVTGASMQQTELLPGVTLTHYFSMSANAPYTGRATVTVGNADVTGVVVKMRAFGTMSGRVAIDPRSTPPADAATSQRAALELDPAGGDTALSGAGRVIRADRIIPGDFSITRILPGQYWLHVQKQGIHASEWQIQSVSWNGRDYTNTPIEIGAGDALDGVVVTVTTANPDFRGTVRDSGDLKADATMVIAFPVDQAQWKNTGLDPARMKTVSVSSTRAFVFPPLPAGDYFVAAISRSFTETWREPAFLSRVAQQASRVTLSWGGKSTVDLTAAVIR